MTILALALMAVSAPEPGFATVVVSTSHARAADRVDQTVTVVCGRRKLDMILQRRNQQGSWSMKIDGRQVRARPNAFLDDIIADRIAIKPGGGCGEGGFVVAYVGAMLGRDGAAKVVSGQASISWRGDLIGYRRETDAPPDVLDRGEPDR